MARFQAIIQGNRGAASRLGSAKSGIHATIRGWEGGAFVFLYERDGKDHIRIAIGPHHNTSQVDLLNGPITEILQGIKDNAFKPGR